jgi:hypothetical protein
VGVVIDQLAYPSGGLEMMRRWLLLRPRIVLSQEELNL